jgi:CrcB protein
MLPDRLNFLFLSQLIGLMIQEPTAISTPIAVSLGAIPGALCRYFLTILLAQWLGANFPFGTFVINLSGALLMGFFVTLATHQIIASLDLQSLIMTGFLGSYTTFSTYALDTSVLLRSGSRRKALFYWAGSVIFGGVCLEIGMGLASTIR